jgi:hypothetical protein
MVRQLMYRRSCTNYEDESQGCCKLGLSLQFPIMKNWFGVLALLAGTLAHAQSQSACPGPPRNAPVSTCGSVEGKGEITVHVATIDTGEGSLNGGYVTAGSRIGPEILADTAWDVERHKYRPCDIGKEIVDRVTDSFQRFGYFCVQVEPIDGQRVGKNEYRIAIHVHPGSQYRLKEVTFSGVTMLLTDELRSAFHMKPKSLFDTQSVRKGLKALQRAYAKKGRLNMTAMPIAEVDEANKTIMLEIKIQEDAQLDPQVSGAPQSR